MFLHLNIGSFCTSIAASSSLHWWKSTVSLNPTGRVSGYPSGTCTWSLPALRHHFLPSGPDYFRTLTATSKSVSLLPQNAVCKGRVSLSSPHSVVPDIGHLFVNENASMRLPPGPWEPYLLWQQHSLHLDLFVTPALGVEVELKALLARRVCTCLEAELMFWHFLGNTIKHFIQEQ